MREVYRAVVAGDRASLCELLRTHEGLLEGETPFGSLLHVAASHGHVELVRELVQLGISPNRRGGTFKGAPINVAASHGQREVVQLLLDLGAELDVSEPERNPLFSAVHAGDLQIVRALVESGIDFRVRYSGASMQDMSAADFAEERGQMAIAEYLRTLEGGAPRAHSA